MRFRAAVLTLALLGVVPCLLYLLDPGVVLGVDPSLLPPSALLLSMFEFAELGGVELPLAVAFFVPLAVAAVVGGAVAVVLAIRGADRPEIRDLALAIALFVFGFGFFFLARPYGLLGLLANGPDGVGPLLAGLEVAAAPTFVVGGFHFHRFIRRFPRPLSRDDVLEVLRRPPAERSLMDELGLSWLVAPFRTLDEHTEGMAVLPREWRHSADERLVHAVPSSPRALAGAAVLTAFVQGLYLIPAAGPELSEDLALWGSVLALFLILYLGGSAWFLLCTQYWTSEGEDRRRSVWLLWGTYATGWASIVGYEALFLWGVLGPDVGWAMVGFVLSVPVFGIGILATLCLAVFYGGALDARLGLRRTTLYGIGGFVGVFVFEVVQSIFTDAVVDALSLPSGSGSWIAAGVVAVLVTAVGRPLARRIGVPADHPSERKVEGQMPG